MKAYEKVAVDFTQALVDAQWESAKTMLTPAMQELWPATKLEKRFRSMSSGYAEGQATHLEFDPEFSMESWPDKQAKDTGWAYVSVHGDHFVEAVTVVVANYDNALKIRDIEWGRP